MIHHIAIGSPNIEALEKFYESLPGLKKIRVNKNSDDSLRSIWFTAGDTILMLEFDHFPKGPKALIFSAFDLISEDLETLPKWIQETEYTKYFKDPDGNLLGYSSYPNPWPF
ncbi:VOC family protein [Leptospira kirschneri]|uniref:Glyoxalase family protein n=2 Tax=Leptospira kirschneri TaxID=29507 RepID=A0A0E2B632_9LEPT|nr:VOC family protein [Leptospira kirschneri]EKO16749.1 glyoxalase family protein [Leptospira kirschneri str. H1]EKO61647.1 glyoxalase family protein [Leptospira kirschneri str. H2]EMK22926.1 glyoxalase family protein [Leptospira kirschneri serovar Bulgarica str. Nikolaevo]UML80724.1 VOC family protein [Leptospira kirschneri]